MLKLQTEYQSDNVTVADFGQKFKLSGCYFTCLKVLQQVKIIQTIEHESHYFAVSCVYSHEIHDKPT